MSDQRKSCANCLADLENLTSEDPNQNHHHQSAYYTLNCSSRVKLPSSPATLEVISINHALSTIFNFKTLGKMSKVIHHNSSCEMDEALKALDPNSPSVPLCFVCYLVVTDLFKIYTEFGQLRKSGSFIGNKLLQVGNCMNLSCQEKQDADSTSDSSSAVNENQNQNQLQQSQSTDDTRTAPSVSSLTQKDQGTTAIECITLDEDDSETQPEPKNNPVSVNVSIFEDQNDSRYAVASESQLDVDDAPFNDGQNEQENDYNALLEDDQDQDTVDRQVEWSVTNIQNKNKNRINTNRELVLSRKKGKKGSQMRPRDHSYNISTHFERTEESAEYSEPYNEGHGHMRTESETFSSNSLFGGGSNTAQSAQEGQTTAFLYYQDGPYPTSNRIPFSFSPWGHPEIFNVFSGQPFSPSMDQGNGDGQFWQFPRIPQGWDGPCLEDGGPGRRSWPYKNSKKKFANRVPRNSRKHEGA